MDRYKKVEQKRPEVPINENEIRITSQGLVRNYISYATTLLQERRCNEITLKGMGQAISKTVAIAEIMKRNIPRLHQETEISSVSITDLWEPIEEGLLLVEKTRNVSMISITLAIKKLDKISPGYQAPILVERQRPLFNNNYQPRQQPKGYDSESYGGKYQENKDPGEGGGRGRRGGGNYRGYGNYPGGRYRNFYSGGGYGNYYQGGGYGRGGGGRYNGRGGRGRM